MSYVLFLFLIIPSLIYSDDENFDNKIKEFILKNPSVIIESINNYQKTIEKKEKEAKKNYLEKNSKLINSSHQILGDENAKYIITEFFDYRCGYCVKAHKELMKLKEKNNNIKIVLKNLPVLTNDSYRLAKVSLAVALKEPKKFEQFHTHIFNHTKLLSDEKIIEYFKKNGIIPTTILKLAQSEKVKQLLEKDFALADDLNISGTPAFVVKKEIYTGWVGNDILESALKIQQ